MNCLYDEMLVFQKGFVIESKRWVVERTFACLEKVGDLDIHRFLLLTHLIT